MNYIDGKNQRDDHKNQPSGKGGSVLLDRDSGGKGQGQMGIALDTTVLG